MCNKLCNSSFLPQTKGRTLSLNGGTKMSKNVVFHYILSTLFPLAFIQLFHQLLWVIFDKVHKIWESSSFSKFSSRLFFMFLGKPCCPLFPSPLKIVICSSFPNLYWYCHGIPLKMWRIDDTKSRAVPERLIFILSVEKCVHYQFYLWVIFMCLFRHNSWKTISKFEITEAGISQSVKAPKAMFRIFT